MRLIYNLVLHLALPVMFARMLWRSRKFSAHRQGWMQRLGFFPHSVKSGGIWIHAVSLGETIAAEPLIKRLHQEQVNLPIIVTSTTATGYQRTETHLQSLVTHSYVPFDTTWAIKRFLNRVQPKVLVIMEKELWPNIIRLCSDRGIKVLVVNACMSESSMRGYSRIPRLSDPMLQALDWVSAQTSADHQRFLTLGVSPKKSEISGSIKFDLDVPLVMRKKADALKQVFNGRPILLAASTHEGEERLVADVFSELQERWPDLLLIIVPRHPERFDNVAQQFRDTHKEWQIVRRSLNEPLKSDTAVYLADTMGELLVWYMCADIAIVGGSFVPVGGHNPIEAAAVRCPVIMGPHVENCREIVAQLEQVGGLKQVDSADMLKKVLFDWIQQPALALQAGEKGESEVNNNRGAVSTIYASIKRFLL